MNIAVIGCGFVGGTVADFLEGHLVNVWRVDPEIYPHTEISYGIKDCDAFIVCVPTPENKDGRCNDSIIKLVIEELDTDKPILLKSTVTPDLMEKYPSNVTYNPEFLRANSAKEDFQKQEVFILGGENEEHMQFWENLIVPHLDRPITIKRMSRTTASMIKYTHNAWLATKVAFFHELFLNTRSMEDFNYSELTSTLGNMKNIGASHMIAPNFEGTFGYGGHCFPKDTEAFYDYSKSEILKTVIEVNNKLRKE